MIASGVEGDPRCMQLGMCGSPRLPDQAILITRDEIPKASSPEANSHAGRVPRLTQMKRGLTVRALRFQSPLPGEVWRQRGRVSVS